MSNWSSLSEFLAMGGYAPFVWGSYGVTALCMVVEVVLLLRRKRTLLQRLSRTNRVTAEVSKSNEVQT
ncbi:MAG: heme exporter protein CcmD [Pseudomonadota bacterium]